MPTPMRPATPTTVCVVGLGYIGLPTAAFLADAGNQVCGVDINEDAVRAINTGVAPFKEPGFTALLKRVIDNGSLIAQTTPRQADAYIIAVPTPFQADKSIDTSYIVAAAKSIAPTLRPGALVVLESTSPPGTTELMANVLLTQRPDLSLAEGDPTSFLVAHCPERVIPGNIMGEMVTNDRVVGGLTETAAEVAQSLYSQITQGEIVRTDAATAEMAKLAENSFRDVNIAFANELSVICDTLGINVWELISIANRHPRVNILQPGPGVGGHCIAVDPWFIVGADPAHAHLIRTAREVNDAKPAWVYEKVVSAVTEHPSPNPTVGVFGITFKPDVDDLRESPSLALAHQFATESSIGRLQICEPNITHLPPSLAGTKAELVSLNEALSTIDIAVLLVDHKPFVELDRNALKDIVIIDAKGVWQQ